jgi:hypothetical protein
LIGFLLGLFLEWAWTDYFLAETIPQLSNLIWLLGLLTSLVACYILVRYGEIENDSALGLEKEFVDRDGEDTEYHCFLV